MEKRIVIIGAGPTGLGAAYRLKELGYGNWALLEKEPYIGGLSSSVKDDKGFTWDKGGHVLFSHYKQFDGIVERLLGSDYLEHERKAYIYSMDRWIPYPFQNNIRHLPKKALLECIFGLISAKGAKGDSHNFKEWILSTFGKGIGKHFMIPQNSKTWGYPLDEMGKDWISDRISVIDLGRILRNVVYKRDDVSWGPNNKFKFPLHGGTGGLFQRFRPYINENLCLNKEITGIDINKKEILLNGGSRENYDILINSSPLDKFIKMINPCNKELLAAASGLKHSSSYIVGIGLRGECRSSKCWLYFPEAGFPFYRVTYFSNYSKNNVPDHDSHWSLMCETAYSDHKRIDKNKITKETINGLVGSKLISENDVKNIISVYTIDLEHAYPIPTIDRDKTLRLISDFLEENQIHSKGRFGGWRYEIGNMDHSVMQGIQAVEKVVLSREEVAAGVK